jgi:hypothetical protein
MSPSEILVTFPSGLQLADVDEFRFDLAVGTGRVQGSIVVVRADAQREVNLAPVAEYFNGRAVR